MGDLKIRGNLNYFYLTSLFIYLSGCAPQNFEFVANSTSSDPCENGCYNEETQTVLYSYFEDIPNERRVDILFIDDNSDSMVEEQENMSQRFPTFVNSLAGINWQIAITTTDVSSRGARGNLLTFGNTNYKVLNPGVANADQLFKQTIQVGVGGSGSERGIYAANLAVDKNEGGWIRNFSHLAVIVLSDEDEFSNGSFFEDYDRPATFISNVKSKLGQTKSFSFHSIITRPDDRACLDGAGEVYGRTYAELSNLTGGIIGDICSPDYGAELNNIAGNIQSAVDSLTLKCAPIGGVVQVTVTPPPPTAITTKVNGTRLTFSPAAPGGSRVALRYECNQ